MSFLGLHKSFLSKKHPRNAPICHLPVASLEKVISFLGHIKNADPG